MTLRHIDLFSGIKKVQDRLDYSAFYQGEHDRLGIISKFYQGLYYRQTSMNHCGGILVYVQYQAPSFLRMIDILLGHRGGDALCHEKI